VKSSSTALKAVTTGCGDEPGVPDLGAKELGHPVDRFVEELGVLVGGAVVLRVQRRILQPEGGRQVDHGVHLAEEPGRDLLGPGVGKAEEDDVESGERLGVVGREHEVRVGRGQARVEIGGARARLGVAGGDHDVELGVACAQAEQFGPRVARRPHDPDLGHGA